MNWVNPQPSLREMKNLRKQVEQQDARIDLAYAQGMQQALAMAAQGAEKEAREIAERRASEARKVLFR